MNDLQVESYLLKKPETSLDYPFGEDCKVFKVRGKMFETLSLGTDGEMARCHCMNLKCDPDEASMLRDIFPSEIPGYHMTKKLWNTVILDGSIPRGEVERMIDNSVMLAVSKMTKKDQQPILV